MPAVEFNVSCKTEPGEKVVVVGSDTTAGSWNPKESQIELNTNPGIYPVWAGSTDLPKGLIEYKFAILPASDGEVRWEKSILNRSLEVTEIAAKLLAEFDTNEADQIEIVEQPTEGVELQNEEIVEQATEELELQNEKEELACASSAFAGTAPAGMMTMMMGTAPAIEATDFQTEAAKAEEVVKLVVLDNVMEATRLVVESTQSSSEATSTAKVQGVPKAQEIATTRKAGKVATAAELKQAAKLV